MCSFETEENIEIPKVNPRSIICRGNLVYCTDGDKLYSMLETGFQKKKLMEGVNQFIITDEGLLFYTTDEGLSAADEMGKGSVMVSGHILKDLYLVGEWVYYYAETGINRVNFHSGAEGTVFDQDWL